MKLAPSQEMRRFTVSFNFRKELIEYDQKYRTENPKFKFLDSKWNYKQTNISLMKDTQFVNSSETISVDSDPLRKLFAKADLPVHICEFAKSLKLE